MTYIISLQERSSYLASYGVHLIPEDPDTRVPPWRDWPSHASCDVRRVRAWFSQPWGIGVVPGPSGLVVLDVDVKNGDGIAALDALQAEHGPLPPTMRARTPSGGRHYYYRCPEIPSGMRWRAALVPSLVEIKTGNRKVSCTPGKHRVSGWDYLPDLPLLPNWVRDLSIGPEAPVCEAAAFVASVDSAYGRKARQQILDRLLSASEGDRNQALFRASAGIHALIAGGELAPFPDPIETLTSLGASLGLRPAECKTTIQSGKKAGMRAPRSAPGRGGVL